MTIIKKSTSEADHQSVKSEVPTPGSTSISSDLLKKSDETTPKERSQNFILQALENRLKKLGHSFLPHLSINRFGTKVPYYVFISKT